MDSYGSCSLRKCTCRAILSLIAAALTVALFSTTATGFMFHSGHEPARQRVLRIYDVCSAQSNLRSDENKVFTECIDRGIAGMRGLYYGALVHAEGSTGYAWNFRTLTGAFERARVECRKNRHKGDCTLLAFVINGCIAHGHGLHGHVGYEVGATKSEARRRMLTGSHVPSCGPRCQVKKVYCTAGSSEGR